MSEAPSVAERVNGKIGAMLKDTVAAGPFAGMKMRDNAVWKDGNYATKLTGSYERELHPYLEMAAARRPRTIINVGCSDGFYAVGMARMMPEARIVAADIDPRSLRLCLENAHINGVAERVAVLVGCRKPEELDRGEPRRLYIVDVEGGEVELLDPARCPALAKSDLIVECHDFFNPAIHNIVASRFKETHHLSLIQPAPPDPKDFPFLFALPMGVLLLAITENRPQPTTWLVGWAK